MMGRPNRKRGPSYWQDPRRRCKPVAAVRLREMVPECRQADGVAVLEQYGLQLWVIVRLEEQLGIWLRDLLVARRADVFRIRGINARNMACLLWAIRRWARGDPPDEPAWMPGVLRRMAEVKSWEPEGVGR